MREASFADVVVAQIEDGAVDHAMMRPEAGFAVADEALVGIDPHQQESVYKKGSNLLDFHRETLRLGGEGRPANRQQSHCQIATRYRWLQPDKAELYRMWRPSGTHRRNRRRASVARGLASGQGVDDADTDAAQVGYAACIFVYPNAAVNSEAEDVLRSRLCCGG